MNRYYPVIILFMYCLVLLGCGNQSNHTARTQDDRIEYRIEHNVVTVDTLVRKSFVQELISNGRIAASKRSVLSFPIDGVIVDIRAKNGAYVKEGDVIAHLDTMQYVSQLRQAELALNKAELELYDVLVGLGYNLKDTITVPCDVLDLARVRSGYADAIATLQESKRTLEACYLRAPFSGKIADIGQQLYERTDHSFCTLLDDSKLNIQFSVLESEYGFVYLGQSIQIVPYADVQKSLMGRIISINPVVNEYGQIRVDAEVFNDGTLTDGMNVRVYIRKEIPDQFTVSKSAVVLRDNMEVLFKYVDGRAKWTYVHTINGNSKEYIIIPNRERGGELNPGDLIITSGNLNLAEGSMVTLKSE